MNGEFDDLPHALGEAPDIMPWDEQPESPIWPWGDDSGTPLAQLSTENLLAKRRWLDTCTAVWVEEWLALIDEVLTERGGI